MRNCLRKAVCTRAFMICSITFRTEKGPAAGQLLRTEPQSRLSFNPDSAVAIDKKREAQAFRSEVDGFLPLSRH